MTQPTEDQHYTLERQRIVVALEELANAQANLMQRVRYGHDEQLSYAINVDLPTVDADGNIERVNMHTQRLEGQDARDYLTTQAQVFKFVEGQPDRAVKRLPGVLVVNDELLAEFEHINKLKAELKDLFKDVSTPLWDKMRRDAPVLAGLVKLQVTREFQLLPASTEAISFAWRETSRSIKRLTVAEAILMLRKGSPKQDEAVDTEHWKGQLNNEQALLETLPDKEILCIARPTAPYIAANIRDANGKRLQSGSSLPLILPASHKHLDLNMLDCDPVRKLRKRRNDQKLSEHPLIPRLHLYRYRDSEQQTGTPVDVELKPNQITLKHGELQHALPCRQAEFTKQLLSALLTQKTQSITVGNASCTLEPYSQHIHLIHPELGTFEINKAKLGQQIGR